MIDFDWSVNSVCKHEPSETPISLAEKQFEVWIVCKKCGVALKKVDYK